MPIAKKINPKIDRVTQFPTTPMQAQNTYFYVIHNSNGVTASIYELLWKHRNNETNECFPSMARLSSISNYSTRTLRRCIRKLEALGVIKVTIRRGDLTNIYSFIPADYNSDLHKDGPDAIVPSNETDRTLVSTPTGQELSLDRTPESTRTSSLTTKELRGNQKPNKLVSPQKNPPQKPKKTLQESIGESRQRLQDCLNSNTNPYRRKNGELDQTAVKNYWYDKRLMDLGEIPRYPKDAKELGAAKALWAWSIKGADDNNHAFERCKRMIDEAFKRNVFPFAEYKGQNGSAPVLSKIMQGGVLEDLVEAIRKGLSAPQSQPVRYDENGKAMRPQK